MNILFIAHENKLNGANKSMINLIDALSYKHKFFVWCPEEEGPLTEVLSEKNISYISKFYYKWCTYFVHQPRSIFHLCWRRLKWILRENHYNKKIALEMVDFLKENHIELIHMNSSIINIGVLLKECSNIPLLWHFREFGKEDFGWDTLTTQKGFYKCVKENADKVVTVSKAVANKYEQYLGENQVQVVYNGVDQTNIHPKKSYHNLEKKKLVLLQAGTLCYQKGQNIAIEAMKILHEEGINNVELLLAGSGEVPGTYSASELKLWGVCLLGQVKNMVELRENVDVELVCSKAEAFGRVTVEAMMGGIPVIGTNSGGTAELIQDGETGLLFAPGNAKELAHKIKFLYFNRKEIERMGKNAFEYSKEYFLISRCAKEIDNIYTEIKNKEFKR